MNEGPVCTKCGKPSEVKPPRGKPPEEIDQRLYALLDQLRTDIGAFRDNMQGPRLQNDVDKLDRMTGMANRAVGIVIGTSR